MENRLTRQVEGFNKTPPLWQGDKLEGLQQFDNLNYTPVDDDFILSVIPSISTNFVLGKRIEKFMEFQLKNSSIYILLASNIQIYREKITIGELDFVIKDQLRDRIIHLEMVYKFYVYDPSLKVELERWIGPNRKDSLLQKIKKLRTAQLPLLYKPETQNYLSTLDLKAENIEQQVFFKANLFLPKNYDYHANDIINKKCIAGYWINLEEFTSGEFLYFQFYAPNKKDWPIFPAHNKEWYSYERILIEIEAYFENGKSPLIWMKKPGENYERFFVVWW